MFIIRAQFGCLEKTISIVHCGSHNKFKNIIVTNIKDSFAFKFDDKTNKFICVDKINKDLIIVLDEPFTKSQGEILELLNDPNNFNIDDNVYDNSITNFLNV